MVNVLVVFYSTYGHNFGMASAAVEGAKEIEGATVKLTKVKETLPEEVLAKLGADKVCAQWKDVPIVSLEDMEWGQVFIFLTPTRYGMMAAQMKTFIDSLGGLWGKDAFVGKVAGAMSSSMTQHGGQESTILSFHVCLLHLGFVIGGLPYSFKGQMGLDEIKGGSPYGASSVNQVPSKLELEGAKYQGKYLTGIGAKLFK
jgi:NAD(P)H dehydrogenase (quinone)